MKDFITKQRAILILGGLTGLVAFGGLSWLLKPSSVLGSISTNLAATSLTIALTATIVDWLISRENEVRNRKTRELAVNFLKSIRFGVEASLCEVYGFVDAFKNGKLRKPKNPQKGLEEYLRKTDFTNGPIYLEYLPILVESIKKSRDTLEDCITLFGYSLSAELKSAIFEYRKATDSYLEWFDGKMDDKEEHLKNRIMAFSGIFYEALLKFYKYIEGVD